MNLETFDALMRTFARKQLGQDPMEWRYFLEFASSYFASYNVQKPVVVEIGIWNGLQRRFYENLLGAEYIGIDNQKPFAPVTVKNGSAVPEIIGDSHDPATVEKLRVRLGPRQIDLLYIDGDHAYESVKRDYELYAPLTKHLVVFHDIIGTEGPARFWHEVTEKEKSRAFVMFKKDSSADWILQMGVGLMVKGE